MHATVYHRDTKDPFELSPQQLAEELTSFLESDSPRAAHVEATMMQHGISAAIRWYVTMTKGLIFEDTCDMPEAFCRAAKQHFLDLRHNH